MCRKADSSFTLGGIDARRAAVLKVLGIDQVTVEVEAALRAAGLDPVLLKGPALEAWTPPERRPRTYTDTDLLVDPARFGDAAAVLAGLGFRCRLGIDDSPSAGAVASVWERDDGATVDLHRSIIGLGAPPEAVWAALGTETEPIAVAGRELRCLAGPARALHVALHAAQLGEGSRHVVDDLAGALELAGEDAWRGAYALAQELDGVAAFAAGLRELANGERLARVLGVPDETTIDLELRRRSNTPMLLGVQALASASGWRARAGLVAREAVPTRPFMQAWAPRLAARGPLGLLLAYLWRPLWLLANLPRALWLWLRARRVSARSR